MRGLGKCKRQHAPAEVLDGSGYFAFHDRGPVKFVALVSIAQGLWKLTISREIVASILARRNALRLFTLRQKVVAALSPILSRSGLLRPPRPFKLCNSLAPSPPGSFGHPIDYLKPADARQNSVSVALVVLNIVVQSSTSPKQGLSQAALGSQRRLWSTAANALCGPALVRLVISPPVQTLATVRAPATTRTTR